MIRCRTQLNEDAIKALTGYHIENNKKITRSKRVSFLFGLILLIISCINAYGTWMKYYGSESISIVFIKSFLFVFLSLFILFTAVRGRERNLSRDLKKYFSQTDTTYIDYIISEEGIKLIVNDKGTMFEWNVIDHMESDDRYYYFSSKGRHSIIAKEPVSSKNLEIIDRLINRMNDGKL